MKKFFCFFGLLLSIGHSLAAQSPLPVAANIQVNQVNALVNSDGTLFTDGQNGRFIPIKAGLAEKTLLRGSGLWIAGKDPAGNLKGAVNLNGASDLTPGALDENGLPYADILNNVWEVSCADIREHLTDFNDNGVIDHPNAHIYAYPGKGNPAFSAYNPNLELPFTSQALGGFFDRDEDAAYAPGLGDYPTIEMRGCNTDRYPNGQYWFVSNDQQPHQSGLNPNHMEVQTQVFAYRMPDESPLNNAVYVRYKIINRSQEPLDSCYFGVFADFDIGNPDDDFIGSIPDKSVMYGYNGDTQDEDGFGAQIPVMAVDLLRGPLDDLGYEIGIRHMMAIETADNLLPYQYFNLLSGRFATGAPAPNNGLMFTDNPNIPNGNSETGAGNTPGQRAGLASFGPFKLLPGAVNEMIVGYYYVHTPGATPLQNVQRLYSDAALIQQLFDNCFENTDFYCDGVLAAPEPGGASALQVYPNPARLQFTVANEGEPFSNLSLKDLMGREIRSVRLESPVKKYVFESAGLPAGAYILTVGEQTGMLVIGL